MAFRLSIFEAVIDEILKQPGNQCAVHPGAHPGLHLTEQPLWRVRLLLANRLHQVRQVYLLLPGDYSGQLLFFFENGKAARVELKAYATVSNRRRLTGAYSDKSPLRTMLMLKEDAEVVLYSAAGRALIFSSAMLAAKVTRSTQGVAVMTLKKNDHVERAALLSQTPITQPSRYRARTIPAAGMLLKDADSDQMKLEL